MTPTELTDHDRIHATLKTLNAEDQTREVKALGEGYKDEVCPECKTVLLAFHHFIRCNSGTCPLKLRDSDGHAPSLLDMMRNGVPK